MFLQLSDKSRTFYGFISTITVPGKGYHEFISTLTDIYNETECADNTEMDLLGLNELVKIYFLKSYFSRIKIIRVDEDSSCSFLAGECSMELSFVKITG